MKLGSSTIFLDRVVLISSLVLGYKDDTSATVFFPSKTSVPIFGGFITFYILFWLILTLYLLIMQVTT